jgi:SWI/SNF related-matrix-associated actin-dependent regulator of chromatin subfamily C
MTSFLAALVPPEVAKAAAQAAVAKISAKNKPSSPSKTSPPSPSKSLEKAAATALGAAAGKAHHLASLEEIEMQKATRVTIELQLRKMELKLSYFQDMEALLETERIELQQARHDFYMERLDFKNGIVRNFSDIAKNVDVDGDVDMSKDAIIAPLN